MHVDIKKKAKKRNNNIKKNKWDTQSISFISASTCIAYDIFSIYKNAK